MSERDYTDWVEAIGDLAKPPDYDADPSKYECEFRHVFQGDWRPFTTSAWPVFLPVRVRLRQPSRDYSDWVEGKGDSAKPADYGQNPAKYEVEVWDCDPKVLAWERYRFEQKPLWMKELRYRVRLRRQEPDAQSAPEPPILKSLVIRPDGCVVLIGGTSVKIPHSAALDLAGELCRSRRQ